MDSVVIEVSSVESIIYGQLLGCFLAIRESGLVEDAENFFSLAYAEPCWRHSGIKRRSSACGRRMPMSS